MATRSQVRYTTITAPAGTDYGTLNAIAAEKAKSLAKEGELVAMAGALSVKGVQYRVKLAWSSGRSSTRCFRPRNRKPLPSHTEIDLLSKRQLA